VGKGHTAEKRAEKEMATVTTIKIGQGKRKRGPKNC